MELARISTAHWTSIVLVVNSILMLSVGWVLFAFQRSNEGFGYMQFGFINIISILMREIHEWEDKRENNIYMKDSNKDDESEEEVDEQEQEQEVEAEEEQEQQLRDEADISTDEEDDEVAEIPSPLPLVTDVAAIPLLPASPPVEELLPPPPPLPSGNQAS